MLMLLRGDFTPLIGLHLNFLNFSKYSQVVDISLHMLFHYDNCERRASKFNDIFLKLALRGIQKTV